jgi:hypothetical protein
MRFTRCAGRMASARRWIPWTWSGRRELPFSLPPRTALGAKIRSGAFLFHTKMVDGPNYVYLSLSQLRFSVELVRKEDLSQYGTAIGASRDSKHCNVQFEVSRVS